MPHASSISANSNSRPEDLDGDDLMRTFIKKVVVERVCQHCNERPDTVAKVAR